MTPFCFLSMASGLEGVGESIDFLLDHLRSWTPAFFAQIEKTDQRGFFGDLSKSSRNLLLT